MNKNLLFVTNHNTNKNDTILINHLNNIGYNVSTYYELSQAYLQLKKHNIAIIILNQVNCELNCLTFIKKIRENNKLKDIPILVLNKEINKNTNKLWSAGVDFFLYEPDIIDNLELVVRSLIIRYESTLNGRMYNIKDNDYFKLEGSKKKNIEFIPILHS